MTYDAAIVPCADYSRENVEAALREVLKPISGLSFVKPGAKVVIKANLVTLKRPEGAATTHPSLLAALTKMLVEAGANVVIGDSPGGPFTYPWLKSVYMAAGLSAAVNEGAALNKNMEISEGDAHGLVLREFHYTSYLDDADFIIDFAKLKTHGMMAMTGAVKNMFGAVPGTQKPEYHYNFPKSEDFANMLIDIYNHFAPSLCIIDAVEGMEGNGPTAGTPRKIGALIASKNGFFADMVGARVIGADAAKIPIMREAVNRGLCPDSLDALRVFGDVDRLCIEDYKLMQAASVLEFKTGFTPLERFLTKALRSRPALLGKLCIGCGRCFKICPAHAITMRNSRPAFDRKKCIKCFCCQEFCEKSAIVVRRPVIAKIVGK